MTTDIFTISGRSRAAGVSLCRWAISKGKLVLSSSLKLSSVVRGLGRAAGWKGIMDRIAFGAILLLALGLWIHPYLTGTADSASQPVAAAVSPIDRNADPIEIHPAPRVSPPPPAPQAAPTPPPITLKVTRGAPGFWRLAQTSSGVW